MIRVVIVDDDESQIRLLQDMIPWDEYGLYLVGTAKNGEDGYKLVRDVGADIVITDIVMPILNGTEMIKKIRSTGRKVEIIVVTGYRKFEYATELVKYSIFDMLVKPVKCIEIENVIKRVVKRIDNTDGVDNLCRIIDGKDAGNGNLIARAINYMDSNYKSKITLDMVADALFVSSWHLCKMFKKYTGKSYIDILNIIRVAKAKDFLRNSRVPIGEIGKKVGFSDFAYFSAVFKKITSYTPSDYRNSTEKVSYDVPSDL